MRSDFTSSSSLPLLTLLKCLAAREIPIPPHFDVYLLDHEAGLRRANIFPEGLFLRVAYAEVFTSQVTEKYS